MSLLIFLIILSALVIVHELGHFLVAKKFGIRVDEFGLGYPPRAKALFTWRETLFTINWLPFGGFVKIFGENPEQSELSANGQEGDSQATPTTPLDSFQSKNRAVQASVLIAGVLGNFIFAWGLISYGFVIGLPAPANFSAPIENPRTVITLVLPSSPAEESGLKSGDIIISLERGDNLIPLEAGKVISPEEVTDFIALSSEPISLEIERGGKILEKTLIPKEGIVAGRPAVGISMDLVGIAKLNPTKALWYGLKTTSELTLLTGQAFLTFFGQAFQGVADISSVTGPVGIVGMVGDARELGFVYLLTFTAIISINLSIINLLPFPALDGGRLFFILIEAITRRQIPPKVFNLVNAVGFAMLILLMVLVTIHDIRNIF